MLQPSAERGDWMTMGQSDAGKKEGVECGRVRNEAVFGPSKLSGKKGGESPAANKETGPLRPVRAGVCQATENRRGRKKIKSY